jgi:PBP1b-binding outer membrane lipoprotein LpoB
MKSKIFMIAAATMVMASCSSPEKRSEAETDTTQHTVVSDTIKQDSTAAGTLKATGSMNGSNNSGVNSSDGVGQKADKSKDSN